MQTQLNLLKMVGGLQVAGFTLCFCGLAAHRLARLYEAEKSAKMKKRAELLNGLHALVDGALRDYGGITQAPNGEITLAAMQKVILTEAAIFSLIKKIIKAFKIADFERLRELAAQRRGKDFDALPLRTQKELGFLENLTEFLESRAVENFDVLNERASANGIAASEK